MIDKIPLSIFSHKVLSEDIIKKAVEGSKFLQVVIQDQRGGNHSRLRNYTMEIKIYKIPLEEKICNFDIAELDMRTSLTLSY